LRVVRFQIGRVRSDPFACTFGAEPALSQFPTLLDQRPAGLVHESKFRFRFCTRPKSFGFGFVSVLLVRTDDFSGFRATRGDCLPMSAARCGR
jgi:hypothetical protein